MLDDMFEHTSQVHVSALSTARGIPRFQLNSSNMLERYLGPGKHRSIGWDDLGNGSPTISALARLASDVLGDAPETDVADLSLEARAILFTARQRGVIAIRGSIQAFDSIDRFLSVCVEVQPDQFVRFGSKESPRQKILFLEGFAQLCRAGLVIHHSHHEFSLTSPGFELAESVDQATIARQLSQGVDLDRAEWS